jgi:hypothetical protein
VVEFAGSLAASTELEALLVHVPNVLRGQGWMCIEDRLEQVVKPTDVCGVEILCSLRVETGWFGSVDIIALPIALDPMRSWVLPRHHECERLNTAPVERLCSQGLKLNPVMKDLLLWFGEKLLTSVHVLFAHVPIDAIINSGARCLE